MQRIEDEVLVLIRARMAGDHAGPVTDDHLMHIPTDQHLVMAEPGRHGITGPAIAHQRQGTDPPGALVTGIIGRCGKRLKNSSITLQAFADRLTMTPWPFKPIACGSTLRDGRSGRRRSGTLASAPGSSGGNSRRDLPPCPCRSPCPGGRSDPRTDSGTATH